ncbi:AP-1-like transcription factor 2 [Colletotrichum chlorophyti]|uniref:AP-1-like transcription factor 2 n=1 Tax=Colletotrichum chlorophyti TaxID=708187 RepID=A0A1Q8S335_9PEZI|nr:AP-1-like transcription factor 2 [Colletotrichum chlorophyti]
MTDLGAVATYRPPPIQSTTPASKQSASSLHERAAMSSSLSPDQYGRAPQQPQHGGAGSGSDQDKSPLSSLNLGFLKSLTEKRTTRDGNPPKRRGPKPDSKPALTRRQELNRQAQRTHRERKELYIKALEDEVLRLKEIFSNISQDKDKIAEENRQLKQLLVQNGIPISHYGDDIVSNPSGGYTSSASVSGHSYGQNAYTPPMTSQSTAPSVSPSSHGPSHSHSHSHGPPPPLPKLAGGQQPQHNMQTQNSGGRGVDLEQAGIDFVLTLEKPCMNHMPWLLERSSEMGGEPCGHALMASCPPAPFPELTPDIPFGYSNVNGDLDSQQRTWEVSKGSLAALLDLSKKLNLDGEVTPVMAWGMVLAHPRARQLRPEDFQRLTEELKDKVRCYGFGAVMEEFEVRDALENVFYSGPEMMVY